MNSLGQEVLFNGNLSRKRGAMSLVGSLVGRAQVESGHDQSGSCTVWRTPLAEGQDRQ